MAQTPERYFQNRLNPLGPNKS